MSQTKPNWAGKKCKDCRYHTDCYIRKISGVIEEQNENACGSYNEGTQETKLLHPDIPGYNVIEIKGQNYCGCKRCAFGPYCTHPNKNGKKSCMDSPRAFYTKRLDFSEPQKNTRRIGGHKWRSEMITRTNQVHEKPILFSARMVKAILDGKKTMTRRIIKPQPSKEWHKGIGVTANRNNELCMSGNHGVIVSDLKCPYCKQIGDRLWVRENFSFLKTLDKASPGPDSILPGASIIYTATGENNGKQIFQNIPNLIFGRVRPSIHMPRWASRIDLEITGIAVEQLHDITEEDARAEGVGSVEEFKDLWKTINGPESWDSNPWLWVVKFEVANIRR